jgi:hypothetical protein
MKSQSTKKSSAKQPSEPEEKDNIDFSKTNKDGGFDPLNDEDVIQQEKIHVDIVGDQTKLNKAIPKAEHRAPRIDLDDDSGSFGSYQEQPASGGGGNSGGGGGYAGASSQQAEQEPFNPEFYEMPEGEQDESSLQTAIALVNMYCGVKLGVPKMIAISERRMKKMHKDGEINMYMILPRRLGSVDSISVQDLVKECNEKMVKPFETSEEFKSSVTPILARILKKNGLAMTDTQLLCLLVAQDLAVTAQAAIMAFGARRDTLDLMREAMGFHQQQPPVNRPSQPMPGNPPPPGYTPGAAVVTTPSNVGGPASDEKIAEIVKNSDSSTKKERVKKEEPAAV